MIDARHAVVVDLGYGDAGKGSTVDWLCSPAGGGERRAGGAAGSTKSWGYVGSAYGSAETPTSAGTQGSAGSVSGSPESPSSARTQGSAGSVSGSGSAGAADPEPAYQAVIRFNGGAQAGHNVVAPDGRHHTFAQFGAGTLHRVPTHLSRFMLVEPFALAAEAAHLAELGVPDPFGLLTVDRRALLTTPYHRAANRVRESARDRTPGSTRHGSCGMGIGETVSFSLAVSPDEPPRAGDCRSRATLVRKLTALRDHLAADLELSGLRLPPDVPTPQFCAEIYASFAERTRIVGEEYLPQLLAAGPCVFEGAQGVLLDEWYGFHPHTTWSTTTFANAETLLQEAGLDRSAALRMGVVRTYTTRHGAGPFVTADASLTPALPEPHNTTGAWQGLFRRGHFDAVAHRYALDVCGGADVLVVTHADRIADRMICRAYRASTDIPPMTALPRSLIPDLDYQRLLTKTVSRATPIYEQGPKDARDWPELIGDALATPVGLVSQGPTWQDKSVPLPCLLK